MSRSQNPVSLHNINEHDRKRNDFLDYQGFIEFLKFLLREKCIEGAAAGIAQQVVSKGLSSLSDKQRAVLQKQVLNIYTQTTCPECGNDLAWDEMYWYVTDECPRCAEISDRMQRDN